MLFYFGLILCVASIIMMIIFLIHASNPKIEVVIKEINYKKFKKHEKHSPRLYPYALVNYNYQSIDYETEVLINSKKNKSGDKIRVSFKKDKPEIIRLYTPVQEFIVICALFIAGCAIIYWAYAVKMALES